MLEHVRMGCKTVGQVFLVQRLICLLHGCIEPLAGGQEGEARSRTRFLSVIPQHYKVVWERFHFKNAQGSKEYSQYQRGEELRIGPLGI